MPLAEVARWAVAGVFVLSLAVAGVSDIRNRRIPNWTVIVILLAFVAWTFVGPGVSLTSALAAFGIALAVTVPMYLFKVIGAGDSKLFSVVALFAGLKLLSLFALGTVLIGGAIALGMMVANPKLIMRGLTVKGRGEKHGIPYGAPIALAGLLIMFTPPFGAFHDNTPKAVIGSGSLLK